MQTTLLGHSGLNVTQICLGTWNMSGQEGWGPSEESEAIALIRHAVDNGCTFVDTARGYGKAEETVGKALQAGRRDKVILATKAVQCAPHDLEKSMETSLRNLQTEMIDLFICHWPNPRHNLEAFFEEMERQREKGRIRAFGVSNFNLDQMKVALRYGVTSLQPPYSILWRFPDEVMSFCRENNIALTPYSPMAQGLLAGRYTREKTEEPGGPRSKNLLFSDRARSASFAVAREVDAIADRLGCASSQVALAWVLQTPGITSVLVGASRIDQWETNVKALNVSLGNEDYERLDKMGRAVWEMFDENEKDAMWGWKPS